MAGQPLNATFFAFGKREKSGVLTRASIAFLALAIAALAGFIALNFQFIGPVFSWYGGIVGAAAKGGTPSPEMMTPPAGFMVFFLSLLPFMFVFYVLASAYEAACLRWLIRGESGGGLMGLSLGADTWRVYLTYWIWFFLYIAFSLVTGIIVAVIVAATMMSGAGASGDFSAMGPMLAANVIVRLVIYVVMIYFAVRLAPAAAVSVGRKQFAFFDAWKVTKGRFWALFGAFLLIYLMVLVAEIVLFGVVFGVALSGVWPMLANLGSNPDAQQVSALFAAIFTPQNLVVLAGAYVVLLAFGLIVYVLFYGINARAVIAAAEDGKIQGVAGVGVAQQFE